MLIQKFMSVTQVILIFAMNVSVFMFAIRIMHRMQVTKKLVPIIVTLWCPVHLAWSLLLGRTTWFLALSLCSLFAVIVSVQKFHDRRSFRNSLSEIISVLNLFILQIRSGRSISNVAHHMLKTHSENFSSGVRHALQAVAFSQHEAANFNSPILARFQKTMLSAESERHLACLHLENLRDEFSLMQHFRHKSGQATLQARMQSYICLGLYAFLSILLCSWVGWASVKAFFFPSLILMLIGWAGLHLAGRKRSWKV